MITVELSYNMSIQICSKCGKGHDLSAITCSKAKGLDEKRDKSYCDGELEIVQFNKLHLDEIKKVKNA